MLGFDVFTLVASMSNYDLLTTDSRRVCGARTPMLDVDDPDVLLAIESVSALLM